MQTCSVVKVLFFVLTLDILADIGQGSMCHALLETGTAMPHRMSQRNRLEHGMYAEHPSLGRTTRSLGSRLTALAVMR